MYAPGNASTAIAQIQKDIEHDTQQLRAKEAVIRAKDLEKKTLENSMRPKTELKRKKSEEIKKLTAEIARIDVEIAQIETRMKTCDEEKAREAASMGAIKLDFLRKQGELNKVTQEAAKAAKVAGMKVK